MQFLEMQPILGLTYRKWDQLNIWRWDLDFDNNDMNDTLIKFNSTPQKHSLHLINMNRKSFDE